MVKVHEFNDSGDAYDACQCDESIKDGDILLILPEGVIGLAGTWPVAITEEHGKLHTAREGRLLAYLKEDLKATDEAIEHAKLLAQLHGLALRDIH